MPVETGQMPWILKRKEEEKEEGEEEEEEEKENLVTVNRTVFQKQWELPARS